MNEQLPHIVEESIKLELNVAKLYKFYSTAFPENYNFWKELSLEEKTHANLIENLRTVLLPLDKFPSEILSSSLQDLIEINDKLLSLLKEHNNKPPSKESAFNFALSFEESAGEIHFQHAMNKWYSTEAIKVFQRFVKDDKDHGERIRSYMKYLRI